MDLMSSVGLTWNLLFQFGRVKIAHYQSTQAEDEEEKSDDEVIVDDSNINENGKILWYNLSLI